MGDFYSKCGCNCGVCPLFKQNLKTKADRNRTAEGMKFIGWNPTAEKLKACSGCQSNSGFTYIPKCRVRMCAKFNNFKTCANCSIFPCSEVPQVSIADPVSFREQREKTLGQEISEEDFRAYIEVYAGMDHLKVIRSGLADSEIYEIERLPPLSSRTTNVPEDLADASLLSLHSFLTKMKTSKMGLKNAYVYAVRQTQKKRIEKMFRFLWLVGRHGRHNDDESSLVIDSITYFDNKEGKIPAKEDEMKLIFKILKKEGVKGELVPLIEKEWKTPSGYLRKNESGKKNPAWEIRLFEKPGGKDLLSALGSYSLGLDKQRGKRAYSAFSKIDMRK